MVKWTADDVIAALRYDYIERSELAMEEWALLTEVPLSAPLLREGVASTYTVRNERTIDVLLMRNWGGTKSQSFERLAVEVKVSKADYKNETDDKRAPAWANAHRCAYACPPEIIQPADLPEGWGLLWVYAEPRTDVSPTHRDWNRRATWKRPARRHEPDGGDEIRLMHYLARRASRLEERLRRGEDDAALVAAMRVEVDRMHARIVNRDNAIERQRQRANEALKRLRALGEQRCADCHEVVKAATNRRSFAYSEDGFWQHADADAGARCRMARSEAARLSREQATTTRYSPHRDYASPVETESERAERERELEVTRAEDDAYRALTTDEDHREEARYG